MNVSVDKAIIQLQGGHRIRVYEVEQRTDGTYLSKGIRQIAGIFDYRDVEDVLLEYDIAGNLKEIMSPQRA